MYGEHLNDNYGAHVNDSSAWLLTLFNSVILSIFLWQPLTIYVITWLNIWLFSWNLPVSLNPKILWSLFKNVFGIKSDDDEDDNSDDEGDKDTRTRSKIKKNTEKMIELQVVPKKNAKMKNKYSSVVSQSSKYDPNTPLPSTPNSPNSTESPSIAAPLRPGVGSQKKSKQQKKLKNG